MTHHIDSDVASTSREAIIHDFKHPAKWQGYVPHSQMNISKSINQLLDPQSLLVEVNHTIADIERIFGIMGLGQSLLLGVKSLIGKTLVYHNGTIHIQESGTKFAVRSVVNQEQVIEPEQQDIATTIEGTLGKFAELMKKSTEYYSTPAANDGQFALTA